MIYRLCATFVAKIPDGFIAETGGVGYQVLCATKTADYYAQGQDRVVWIYTHMKDNAICLYGFCSQQEREFFDELTAISGIGPKVALAILENVSITTILTSAATGDHSIFKAVSGVGEKTAQKIVLEIKHKLKKLQLIFPSITSPTRRPDQEKISEVVSALSNMGFMEKNIREILTDFDFTNKTTTADIVRQALVRLTQRKTAWAHAE